MNIPPVTISIEDKIQFIRACRQRRFLSGVLQTRVQQHEQNLTKRTCEITTVLFKRQDEAKKAIEELTQEAYQIDFLLPSTLQCDHLQKNLQEVRQVNMDLMTRLKEGEVTLAALHKQKMNLLSHFTALNQKLHSVKHHYPFQASLIEAGGNLARYISEKRRN
jgi:hypothetical protein